jgi:hypothetical protein
VYKWWRERLLKNVGITDFSNLRDMHCWNDQLRREKETSSLLGKEKTEKRKLENG